MIQLVQKWPESSAQVGEVHDPSRLKANFSSYGYPDTKGVAVKPRALMICGNIGKPMGGFESEFFKYLHGFD